jgi:hypothetical protein
MIASYGETSGFSPVSNEDLTNVNGGSFAAILATVVGFASLGLGTATIVWVGVNGIKKVTGK